MKVKLIICTSFLRTQDHTDPFYDLIVRLIDECDWINWQVFVWCRDVKCGYPPEKIDDYHCLEVCGRWLYRFCRLFAWHVPTWKLYRLFGYLLRPFFAKKFAADIIITQAGLFADLFAGLLPDTRIVDVQHGVIYSRHNGYFGSDGRLLECYLLTKHREFWVYGQGYADCFFRHPDNVKDLKGRVKIIGDVLSHKEVSSDIRDTIVISGQFKPECSQQCLLDEVDALRRFLTDIQISFGSKYNILIKHHPRYKRIQALDVLYREFPFFSETKRSWESLYGRMKVHVTFSSTVVFDAASNGIPSCLLDPPNDDPVLENIFWRDDYHYPFYGKNLKEILELSENPETAIEIKSWFKRFYEPFENKRCLELLTEKGKLK